MDTTDQQLDILRDRFNKLLLQYQIKDRKTGWYSLFKLLPDPVPRKEFVSVVTDYFDILFPNQPLTLLVPDLVVSSYNLVPLAYMVAQTKQYRLAVWAEVGNIADGTPMLYREPLDIRQTCVLLHDVVDTGYTFLKVLPELKKSKWQLLAIVSLIEARIDLTDLNENLDILRTEQVVAHGFQYHCLLPMATT